MSSDFLNTLCSVFKMLHVKGSEHWTMSKITVMFNAVITCTTGFQTYKSVTR